MSRYKDSLYEMECPWCGRSWFSPSPPKRGLRVQPCEDCTDSIRNELRDIRVETHPDKAYGMDGGW